MGNDSTAYEIGLVMAGAVSAGAYSAGVVDFLIEALDEWYQAKEERPGEVPDHDVRLKVMAGSSAGGMTGALAAGALNGDHTPVTSLPGREPTEAVLQSNKLYSAWVEQIDIRPLLGDRDLSASESTVNSLLDSSILEDIAETALDFTPREEKRPYVADSLHLLLTVTNLRGVPYDITFEGNRNVPHRTARHTDHKEFVLSETEPENNDALWLNPREPTSSEWDTLRQYALATGAFPGGLAPRSLSRKRADYDNRKWNVPVRPNGTDVSQCWKRTTIAPSWPPDEHDEEYRFLAVDGGAMNNEPFELARQKLAGDNEFNARSPREATRSVLMVDPLPSEKVTGQTMDENTDILSVLRGLFGSLLTQARFKPDELILAHSPEVHSRYMIVPTRRDRNDDKAEYPIASGMLGGFGGFLKKEFRMHDFQLGRRNCQQFLRKHFGIPKDECAENPVFSHYSPQERDRFSVNKNGTQIMPIIPLVGAAKSEEHPLVWKTLQMSNQELNNLKPKINDRSEIVINEILDQYIDGWLSNFFARMIARSKRNRVVSTIMDGIKGDLKDFGLKQ